MSISLITGRSALVSVFLIALELVKVNPTDLECPIPETITPCTCIVEEEKFKIVCTAIDPNQLKDVIHRFRGKKIKSLRIRKSNLKTILPDTFEDTHLEHLKIIESEVEHFFLFKGLKGLQFSLHKIYFDELTVNFWRLSPDITFVFLNEFIMKNCSQKWRDESNVIKYLPDQLTKISIERCWITSEEQFSFQRFIYLEQLSLERNNLSSVTRDYLPRPARFLKHYSLSYNPISSLPPDMFKDMPSLLTIELCETSLSVLPQDIFKPVMKQLQFLNIWDNPLVCNCDIVWLLKSDSILGKGITCKDIYRFLNITQLHPGAYCEEARNYTQQQQSE